MYSRAHRAGGAVYRHGARSQDPGVFSSSVYHCMLCGMCEIGPNKGHTNGIDLTHWKKIELDGDEVIGPGKAMVNK